MTQPSATFAPTAFGAQITQRNPDREAANLEIARRYLAAIEVSTDTTSTNEAGGADAFYAPDVVQEEFPNRFVPTGARRDLAALRAAAERGQAVLSGQRYHVRAAYAVDETVILEVLWVGILAIAVGHSPLGRRCGRILLCFSSFATGRLFGSEIMIALSHSDRRARHNQVFCF